MRVPVHMQTINDMAVIRASVATVMAQTRPVDGPRGRRDGVLGRIQNHYS